jgi:hypothetical protein
VERWKSQQCGAHPTGAVEWPPATLSKSNNNSKNKNFLVKVGWVWRLWLKMEHLANRAERHSGRCDSHWGQGKYLKTVNGAS